MHVSGKILPVENIPGMRADEAEWWRGELKYDIFEKNFCECHNVPPSSIIIKN
jgi:hypothetical protein